MRPRAKVAARAPPPASRTSTLTTLRRYQDESAIPCRRVSAISSTTGSRTFTSSSDSWTRDSMLTVTSDARDLAGASRRDPVCDARLDAC